MVNTIEAAASAKIPVLVLDRPNPIKAWGASGKEFDPEYASFLAKIEISLNQYLVVILVWEH